MGKFILWKGFTSRGFFASICFWALAGFANASTDPVIPDQNHYQNAWVVLILFALVGLEAWIFWTTWKNRLPEEEPEVKVSIPTPRPNLRTQAPIQRKRTARERIKVPV